MKKYLIIGLLAFTLICVAIIFTLKFLNKPNLETNSVAYDAHISIYVNDIPESVDRLDVFLKQNNSYIESVKPQNEYTLVTFTIPFPSVDALSAFLSDESTDGVILGQKTLLEVFEYEPQGTLFVNVEANLIDVATLNT
jgi:hypothetical protein